MYEVSARQSPEECSLRVVAHRALQVLDADVHSLALNYILPGVLVEVAGNSAGQEVVELALGRQLESNQLLLLVELLLLDSVLGDRPLPSASFSDNEGVPDMLAETEAQCAEHKVLAGQTLVDILAGLNLSQLAPIAVVPVLYADFLLHLLVLLLGLSFSELQQELVVEGCLLVATERTGDFRIYPDLVFCPLLEAAQVE